MIGDAVFFEVVGANLFATPTLANLRLALGRHFFGLLIFAKFQQARTQYGHCTQSVLQLTALVLHCNNQTARNVRDANGRVGGVYALTTWAAGAIHVNVQILFVYFNFNFFGLWHHHHGCRRRMNSALRFRNRNTLHAMRTAFKTQARPSAVALDQHGHLIDTAHWRLV